MTDKNAFKGKVRTIITNAVCGKSTHTCQTTVYIRCESNIEPTQVLGCTIKNAEIHGSKFEDFSNNNINIRIEGEFEVHVWYEVNGDTRVSKSNSKFSEIVPVESFEGEKYYRQEYLNKSILAWISKKPISLGTMIVNRSGMPAIAIQVEYELGVEVIGESKINILSYGSDNEEYDKEMFWNSDSKDEFEVDDIDYDDVD